MDYNLVKYILEQLSKGVSLEQLRNYLLSLNYNANYIDDSINYIKQNYPNYVKPSMKEYVERLLQNGYNKQQIYSVLKKYNVPEVSIQKLFTELFPQEKISQQTVRHEFHVTKNAFILSIILIVVIIGFVFGFLVFKKQPSVEFDIDTSILNPQVYQGDTLYYNVELSNQGVKNTVDISLSINLKDSANNILSSEQKTMAVNLQTSKKFELQIPEDIKAGPYTLEVTANFENKKATSQNVIFIKEKETVATPSVQPSENKTNITVPDSFKKPFEELTYHEMIVRIRSTALINPEFTRKQCESRVTFKQDCILEVAKVSKNIQYCSLLSDEAYRDRCYFFFLTEGSTDRTICDKIRKEELKQACRDIIYQNEIVALQRTNVSS